VTLYGTIADLRREQPTPAAMQTLDLVTAELGKTRDNLDELVARARDAGVYDLDYGPDPYDKPPVESLDEGTAGIGALLAISSLAAVALAVAAVVIGINAILHASSG
jgi:hypothetical protein